MSSYLCVLMVFSLLNLEPFIFTASAATDILDDLGFSTSGEDLENHEERASEQPFGSQTILLASSPEVYAVEIGTDGSQYRLLDGDSDNYEN